MHRPDRLSPAPRARRGSGQPSRVPLLPLPPGEGRGEGVFAAGKRRSASNRGPTELARWSYDFALHRPPATTYGSPPSLLGGSHDSTRFEHSLHRGKLGGGVQDARRGVVRSAKSSVPPSKLGGDRLSSTPLQPST